MARVAYAVIGLLLAGLISACTTTEATLDPSAIAAPTAALQPEASATAEPSLAAEPAEAVAAEGQASAAAPPTEAAIAALPKEQRLSLAPVIGAPAGAVQSLSDRIALKAGESGLPLAPSGDRSATLVLKGYFSAFAENNETTVVYVWDVVDASGNRLHRIQGQEKAPGESPNAWAMVPEAAMQRIADQTIDQLAAWLSSRTG
jgi:hypothetical protein